MRKRSWYFLVFLIWVSTWIVGCRSRPTAEPLSGPDKESHPKATEPYHQVEAPEPIDADAAGETKESKDGLNEPSSPESSLGARSEMVDEQLSQLEGLSLDSFFEASFKLLTLRSPETVLTNGLTEIYDVTDVLLDDISDAYKQETYQLMAGILELLQGYDREALPTEDQVSYDIYQWYLEDQLSGYDFRYHDYPATFFLPTAVHEDMLLFFTDIHRVSHYKDAQDYVTRLGQVGTKIDQLIEGLELRQQAGIKPPLFAIQWAVYGNLGQFVDSQARNTPLYTSLKSKLDPLSSITPEDQQLILDQVEQVIDAIVLPAYQRLASYLANLETYSGGDSGVGRLPQGDAYYQYQLRHFTTLDFSPDDIHQLGLQELEHIHAEIRAVSSRLEYPQDETIVQVYDHAAEDGGHISGGEVLETYENLITEADQNLIEAFDIHPIADVIVLPDQFGGFYISGSVDGSRPGAFYAGVGGTGNDYYGMPTLAYHETIPGHHFQISLAQEMSDLPSFRQALTFAAYAEGWALYAEQLAWELGWYEDDPYGYLGLLQAQAFRAARLVVDTGLHAKGWTFDQAQEFFTENTGFEVGDSVHPQHQIARYLVWPGQSTSYYIGYLKILELRQKAIGELGEQFDLKEFHRIVLSSGSMPLEILEQVVDQYIQDGLGS